MEPQQVQSQLKFVLNAQVPDVETAWMEGYEMCRDGVEEVENPYGNSSRAHHHWVEGWWAGFYGEDPVNAFSDVVSVQVSEKEAILSSKKERWGTVAFEIGCVLFITMIGFELAEMF